MKYIRLLILLFTLPLLSCSDDVPAASSVDIKIVVELPEQFSGHAAESSTFHITNLSTGNTIDITRNGSYAATVSVSPGLYTIRYDGTATLDGAPEVAIHASVSSVTISAPTTVSLPAYATVETDDLIISEIFFTGTLQTSGNSYNGDQYFKLYNNTDHVIYADGLVIFESLFLTTEKFNYEPNIINSAVSVDALYAIPGSGKNYPVAPGESLLIADIAIDHRTINPNSLDLSHADFEWYDVSTSPMYTDIDNPAVPNLDKWYCYTQTIWQLHDRGFKAYGLARIPEGKDAFMAAHYYTVDYENITVAGAFPMTKRGYWLPNDMVVDVVNLSIESNYQWNVTDPSLDSGYTYCGTINNDKTRYFHSVRRKFLAKDGDRIVLADTNNSGDDFNPFVVPSEIELQKSVTDISGATASTVTIDGITPAEQ
ncbi:MAG: DUF4876 domain-containing protein [Muribaculaceae bacterium]|nr:DUF4876 domain-containing protein [Muribaculaceae bacterium]